ncbi:hypothetical protein D0Z07_8592 [Hyphodiscus hymeniophilus]|uniref:NAD(P)-binding protein n=1 Tax=Hyphodiscus hymeniophilus TaxID=353542 RepID=A0A9P6SN27_9HELO|nr:hypothetical protein D0Z07_8592 [Hyphodiscus hymeniophilus]
MVVVGSGPGIGLSTASIFASRKFSKIVLISRDSSRLSKDKASVLEAANAAGREVEVSIFSQDIAETKSFEKTLKKVEELGEISCVFYNAARVCPSDLMTYAEEEVIKDFMITNIGLLTTARWAMPLLTKSVDKPSLLVTNSMMWKRPVPQYFALSMVKTSQRTLVQMLKTSYPDVHVAMVNVEGIVSPKDPIFSPKAIGEKIWEVYEQDKGNWTLEENILAL